MEFVVPRITAHDIYRAAEVMGLPAEAFGTVGGGDPRMEVLLSNGTMDIAACPGSGKTTLLAAKLLILAEKWEHRTRGICVLSHTNAARREIQVSLGNNAIGRRLLTYPHFIGTIHGFTNEFLALPWLRSCGYPVEVVDNDACEARRWYKLSRNTRRTLERQHLDAGNIRISDSSFNVKKRDADFPFSDHTPTYREVQRACKDVALEGYHCFDDMFVWASDLMEKRAEIADTIRARFPLIFVDEAQDNSEEQSQLLYKVFVDKDSASVVVRLGDANQSIYTSVSSKASTTFVFPIDGIKKDLPTSHRFGQQIADLANPLGVKPSNLVGRGPKQRQPDSKATERPHTVFLFDGESVTNVLPAYSELLISTFSEQELSSGTFTAVGLIHRPSDEPKPAQFPHDITDYWPEYDAQMAGQHKAPSSLLACILAGRSVADKISECFPAVEKLAEGILHLSSLGGGARPLGSAAYLHRRICRRLDAHQALRIKYAGLASDLCTPGKRIVKQDWPAHANVALEIAQVLAGTELHGDEVDSFLAWEPPIAAGTTDMAAPQHANIYRFPPGAPQVSISVGSIHSVKGQTHTATLVVETFYRAHNLSKIADWLTGARQGWKAQDGPGQAARLKSHYVAMTRPSHLLCLAMNKNTFCDAKGTLATASIDALHKRGWQIVIL